MKVQEFKEELDALIERNPWVKDLEICIPCNDPEEGDYYIATDKDFPLHIAKGVFREHCWVGGKIYTDLKHYDDLYRENNTRNCIAKEDCNIVIITY